MEILPEGIIFLRGHYLTFTPLRNFCVIFFITGQCYTDQGEMGTNGSEAWFYMKGPISMRATVTQGKKKEKWRGSKMPKITESLLCLLAVFQSCCP